VLTVAVVVFVAVKGNIFALQPQHVMFEGGVGSGNRGDSSDDGDNGSMAQKKWVPRIRHVTQILITQGLQWFLGGRGYA
jgi:hypothetical protein